MQVKDLLIEALARANHIQRSFGADAGEITEALKHFNAQIRKYSDANLVTACQKTVDFTPTTESTLVGNFTLKKGVRLHCYKDNEDLPDLTDFNPTTNPKGLAVGRDFCFKPGIWESNHLIYKIGMVGETSYAWLPVSSGTSGAFATIPRVLVQDMQKIMAAMFKNVYDEWVPMSVVPLTLFYTDDRKSIYTVTAAGENKSNFIVKDFIYSNSRQVRLVYNTSMKFEKNDYLELPEAHIELLTLAVTCAILREDCDADQTQLTNYANELKSLENQIIEQSTSVRPIYREALSASRVMHNREIFTGNFLVR